MTQNQIDNVIRALDTTKKMLAKETDYPLHLQNSARVSFLTSHIAKLSAMIEENANQTYLGA